MDRRHFAKHLAAAALLAPFAPLLAPRRARAAAAGAAPRRLVVVVSLGADNTLWRPTQAPGQRLVLPNILAPLAPVADQLVLADGLSFANPKEGHSTPQTLTGFTFANGYGPSCNSVDQAIAGQVGRAQRLPSLLLGWQANGESQFWSGGRRLTTLDDPNAAWQSAFGGLVAPQAAGNTGLAARSGPNARRQEVWRLVHKQAERMAAQLTGDERARLQAHVNSMTTLLARGSAAAAPQGCAVPAQPVLNGADPQADANQALVSAAHAGLIPAALACDVTRVVGMQFGTSNKLFLGGSVNDDEHSAVHSGLDYRPKLIASEQTVASWVAQLAQTLAATPDPLAPGSTLLDNTLIVWARDMGHGPTHAQYSLPYALLGAGSYLGKQPGGRYLNFGGDDASATVGSPHQRLLLNLIEYMGAGTGQDFGTVSALAAAERAPLAQLRG